MPTLVYVDVNNEQEWNQQERNDQEWNKNQDKKEDKESVLSQVHEKLYSSDCTSFMLKLFNMLHNEWSSLQYTSDVLNTINDEMVYPLEMENLDMPLSVFEKDSMSAMNEKEIFIDMGIKQ